MENVDRRKGFMDIVERLAQGVVAVTLTESVYASSSDEENREPGRSTTSRTHRR